ncbi:hypothetical protein [Streptomyces cyaneogriseus]|nr:hypothetical protein [Streptomyces cyaneogriseus]
MRFADAVGVITSYSIHYTKLYESTGCGMCGGRCGSRTRWA